MRSLKGTAKQRLWRQKRRKEWQIFGKHGKRRKNSKYDLTWLERWFSNNLWTDDERTRINLLRRWCFCESSKAWNNCVVLSAVFFCRRVKRLELEFDELKFQDQRNSMLFRRGFLYMFQLWLVIAEHFWELNGVSSLLLEEAEDCSSSPGRSRDLLVCMQASSTVFLEPGTPSKRRPAPAPLSPKPQDLPSFEDWTRKE